MRLRSRLERLEAAERAQQRAMVAEIAFAYGLTADEMLAEADDFFSLPLADQLREVNRLAVELAAEGLPFDDAEEVKAVLRRGYRP